MWVLRGLENAGRMGWQVWWALVLGFALSGAVQAWVPRERLQRVLGGRGPRELTIATGLGAASSSCSYAAISIARSLFAKGASLPAAMAFQFASTNLVFELGLVLWTLIGWRFTLAEFVGGVILILLLWVGLRFVVPPRAETALRERAQLAESGHVHDHGERPSLVDVAQNFRMDIQMLWKEIVIGFVVAGYVSLLPKGFFNALFLVHGPGPLRAVENAVVGPLVAALSFVCSIGNVPLAAVLWAGGSTFAGVVSFLFADLIILPIVSAYRRYYGTAFALRLTALMFLAMVCAGLLVDGLFSAVGLVPSHRPSISAIADRPVTWNYTSFLDVAFAALFVFFISLTSRRFRFGHAG